MASTSELLDAVNAAIVSLLGGALEVQIFGRRYRMSQLSELKAFRRELMDEQARASGSGGMVRLAKFGNVR